MEEIRDALNEALDLARVQLDKAKALEEAVEEEEEEGLQKEKRQAPPVVININRYFDASSVLQGRSISVYTEISFVSPLVPSSTVWFNNYGDNLGGSNANGPLSWNYTNINATTNLLPSTVQKTFVPSGGFNGCQRLWASGGSYPGSSSFGSGVWKPINPNTLTKLSWVSNFAVAANATPGLVLGTVTRATPVSLTNYTADKFMINMGAGCTLNVLTGSTGLPAQMYRTCTILEGTDTVPTDDSPW